VKHRNQVQLRLVECVGGKYLYRCGACGYETPETKKLGPSSSRMLKGETALKVHEAGLSCHFLRCNLWRSTKSKSFQDNFSIGVTAAAMNIR
jgi:hypothetical protein